MKLTLATCQFPVSSNIRRNMDFVLRQMKEAHRRGAHAAHFSESALCGHAGVEFESFTDFDWGLLESCTHEVMTLARKLRLWVILGSCHRLTGRHKPHISLYVINDRGRIVERYDKRFCTGDRTEKSDDLAHYSPGDHLSVVRIRGIACGLLICHDFRYPELYREYDKRGVRVMFNSFHNARVKPATIAQHGNIWGVIVPPTLQGYAANSAMWISVNNSSTRVSCWPSFFVTPDGRISGKLPPHRAAVLISTVDTGAKFYDASAAWRERAIRGTLHSGSTVRDPRSACRTKL